MIRISKKADYAVFAMGYLARHAANCEEAATTGGSCSPVSAQEIATVADLNKSVVANLLKDLARAGLLDSVRGVHGGYRLARASSSISLAEILDIVDGPTNIVDCADAMLSGGLAGLTQHHQAAAQQITEQFSAESSAEQSSAEQSALEPTDEQAAPQTPEVRVAHSHHDGGCCNLAGFCPSKHPMQVLNSKVRVLLEDLKLDELSGVKSASCSATFDFSLDASSTAGS